MKSAETNGSPSSIQDRLETEVVEYLFNCTLAQNREIPGKTVAKTPLAYHSSNAVLFLPSLLEKRNAARGKKAQRDSTATGSLRLKEAETILRHGVSFFLSSNESRYFLWLMDCYENCTKLEDDLRVFQAWTRLVPSEFRDVSFLRALIVRNASLCIFCPQYFLDGLSPDPQPSLKAPSLCLVDSLMLAISTSKSAFLEELFTEMETTSSQETSEFITGCFKTLSTMLEERQLNDLKFPAVKVLKELLSVKGVTRLVKEDVFVGPFEPPGAPPNAWVLQNKSLLGHILRPTPLDWPLYAWKGRSSVSLFEKFYMHLEGLRIPNFEAAYEEIMTNIRMVALDGFRVSRILFAEPWRAKTLQWFHRVLAANENGEKQLQKWKAKVGASWSPCLEAKLLEIYKMSCLGFNLNVFWNILLMVSPVEPSKIHHIDPFYMIRMDERAGMGKFFDETRFGDSIKCNEAANFYKTQPECSLPPKFVTSLLFLCFKALKTLLLPAVREYEGIVRRIAHSSTPLDKPGDSDVAFIHAFNSVVLHPAFLENWWHFCSLTWNFFGRIFYLYDETGQVIPERQQLYEKDRSQLPSLLNKEGMAKSAEKIHGQSHQLAVLPLSILEDIGEILTTLVEFTPGSKTDETTSVLYPNRRDLLEHMNKEMFVSFSLYVMRMSQKIPSSHCRYISAVKPLIVLTLAEDTILPWTPFKTAVQCAIPSFIHSFFDCNAVDFMEKMSRTAHYITVFGEILLSKEHARVFVSFAESPDNQETISKFIVFLVECVSSFFNEGVSLLAEIKRRETIKEASKNNLEGKLKSQRESLPESDTASSSNNLSVSSPYAGSFNATLLSSSQLEWVCNFLMETSQNSLDFLALFTKICGKLIMTIPLVLDPFVTSTNSYLECLLGPKCYLIKVSDYEKYKFNPRLLLQSLCSIYINLNMADGTNSNLVNSVCSDERFFNITLFKKAYRVAKREGLMSAHQLENFDKVIRALGEKSAEDDIEQQWLNEIWEEIPEDFKDPIMGNVIVDPVILPTSRKIMDRKIIERHLLTEGFDPFNRMPLRKEDLIPDNDLHLQIQEYLKSMKLRKTARNS